MRRLSAGRADEGRMMEKRDEFEDALEICPTDQGFDRKSRDELDQVISVA